MSKIVPGGNYLLSSNVYANISGGAAGQSVSVTCTLQAASGSQQVRTVSIEVGANMRVQRVAIPMTFPRRGCVASGTVQVSCSHSSTRTAPNPTVNAVSTLNAIATSSNS